MQYRLFALIISNAFVINQYRIGAFTLATTEAAGWLTMLRSILLCIGNDFVVLTVINVIVYN